MKLSKVILIIAVLMLGSYTIVTYAGFDDRIESYAVSNEKAFRAAAEQGQAEAQYHLALMYDRGIGVVENHDKAVEWYRKAAEQGYAKAQYNLGMMYYFGKGVPENKVTGYQWVILAAERGEPTAVDAMTELAKKISNTQIAEAQTVAKAWSQAHPGPVHDQ